MRSVNGRQGEQKPRASKRTLQRLRSEALNLPASERADLACSLIESIEGDEPGRSPNRESWDAAWAAEIARRLADFDTGRPGVPAAAAMAALRQAR
jgi:hypothetical protein